MHITYELTLDQLPRDCITDCSQPGRVDEAVEFWRKELDFTVDRNNAIKCLKDYGAWEREELEALSNEELAEKVLWLACGDFSEFLVWQADNPDKEARDADCGSDVYVLE